tara:strand:+ start:180 stop:1022 length:843 start_codon:yes stop_codon:yes gene_type:complete
MSLSYSNLPVYVGGPNSSSVGEANRYVSAIDANVSFSASAAAKRNLGESVNSTDQFKFQGPRTTNISFKFILDTSVEASNSFLNDANQSAFFPIKIGTNFYKNSYLSNYSVSISPFQPVTVAANFISMNPPSGDAIKHDASPYGGGTIPFNPDGVIYGYTCSVTNMDHVIGNVQSQINYTKEYTRTPVYTLGSTNAETMLLDGVESEMNITSTGLVNSIDYSGDKLGSDVSVGLQDIDGTAYPYIGTLTMSAGARVLTTNYSVNGGDTVVTTAEIRQIDL